MGGVTGGEEPPLPPLPPLPLLRPLPPLRLLPPLSPLPPLRPLRADRQPGPVSGEAGCTPRPGLSIDEAMPDDELPALRPPPRPAGSCSGDALPGPRLGAGETLAASTGGASAAACMAASWRCKSAFCSASTRTAVKRSLSPAVPPDEARPEAVSAAPGGECGRDGPSSRFGSGEEARPSWRSEGDERARARPSRGGAGGGCNCEPAVANPRGARRAPMAAP